MGFLVLIDDEEREQKAFLNLCSDRKLADPSELLAVSSSRHFLALLKRTVGRVRVEDVDCIFVDLVLKPNDERDRSGLDAADLLRKEVGNVPIIAYTRHFDFHTVSEISAREFDGILLKQEFMDTTRFSKERFDHLLAGWRKKRGLGPRSSGPLIGEHGTILSPSILHLSDLQFGSAYLKPRDLADSIVHAVSMRELPNIVVVSGDLGQTGDPGEYEQAGEFLARLCTALGIPEEERARVVICPGNHDVSWVLSIGAYFDQRGTRRTLPLTEGTLFQYRLSPFFEFCSWFYAKSSVSGGLLDGVFEVRCHKLSEFGLMLASINSSCSEDQEKRIGRISDEMFERIEAVLKKSLNGEILLIGAVMHHPLQVGAVSGTSAGPGDAIDDPTTVARRLWTAGARFVLTGHIHASSVEFISIEAGTRKSGGGLVNLLAGSAGVPEDDRPTAGAAGHFANEFGVFRATNSLNQWELDAYYFDAASRAFLPKAKFSGPSATRKVTLLKAFGESNKRR